MLRSSLLPLAAATAAFALPAAALADGVTITSYGHSALLINGGGASVLVNPFKAVACAAGLKEPRIKADVVLASSLLLDEGAPVAKGRFLASPGGYSIKGLRFEGFAAPHDRLGGRRFGNGVIWRWQQGGLDFAHLGTTTNAEDQHIRPAQQDLVFRLECCCGAAEVGEVQATLLPAPNHAIAKTATAEAVMGSGKAFKAQAFDAVATRTGQKTALGQQPPAR